MPADRAELGAEAVHLLLQSGGSNVVRHGHQERRLQKGKDVLVPRFRITDERGIIEQRGVARRWWVVLHRCADGLRVTGLSGAVGCRSQAHDCAQKGENAHDIPHGLYLHH